MFTDVTEEPAACVFVVDGDTDCVLSSETLVVMYKTTQQNNPEDCDPNFLRLENLKLVPMDT